MIAKKAALSKAAFLFVFCQYLTNILAILKND